jgi:hypothetical protein
MTTSIAIGAETKTSLVDQQEPALNKNAAPDAQKATKSVSVDDERSGKNENTSSGTANAGAGKNASYNNTKTDADVSSTTAMAVVNTDTGHGIAGGEVAKCEGHI